MQLLIYITFYNIIIIESRRKKVVLKCEYSAEAFDHGYMCGLSNAAEIIGNVLEMDFKTDNFS